MIIFCKDFNLSAIILFGSRLPQRKGLKKDYALSILPRGRIEEGERLSLICQLSQILKTDDLDLVILNSTSPLLQYEIAQKGQIIYERDKGSFNQFQWYALQRWNDNRKFYNLASKYIKDYLKRK